MNNPLTFGTACSGIDGMDLGFRQAGLRCVFQCEILPFDRELLAQNFPECTHRFADVREIGSHNLPHVDLYGFGFMCTDITSVNRHSKDIHADTRSGNTWRECIRVAEEIRPRFLVIENVADLYTRGLDTVLQKLAQIGFDAEWHCIPASHAGAPHERQRVFILAYSNDKSRFQANTPALPFRDFWEARKDACRSYWSQTPAPDWSVPSAVSVRMADGVPYRMDRTQGIGNSIVPDIPRLIGQWFQYCFDEPPSETIAAVQRGINAALQDIGINRGGATA